MAVMGTIDIDAHVHVGIVRPGDKLVIAVNRRLSPSEVGVLQYHYEKRLPGVEVVAVEAAALMVYRPAVPAETDGPAGTVPDVEE